MKPLPIFAMLLGLPVALVAQESTSPQMETVAEETQITGPIADGRVPEPLPAKEPIRFKVLNSVTKRVEVSEAPELSDLPPVTGTINMTMQLVEDPGLPPLEKPLPPNVSLEDPLVQERLSALRKKYRETKILFVSARVLDYNRTILEVYPNGQVKERVRVVSSIDYNDFSGFATFNVAGESADGSGEEVRRYALIMGISNEITANMERFAAKVGKTYQPPELPEIPIDRGHNFVVIDGDNAEGIQTIVDMHTLYSVEGGRMREARLAREEAYRVRRAYLLANPEKPKDVTFKFWKKAASSN
jgi:hypothetical protein